MNRRTFLKVAAVGPAAVSTPVNQPLPVFGATRLRPCEFYDTLSAMEHELMLRKALAMEQMALVMNAAFYHGSATLRRSRTDVDDWEVTPELPC